MQQWMRPIPLSLAQGLEAASESVAPTAAIDLHLHLPPPAVDPVAAMQTMMLMAEQQAGGLASIDGSAEQLDRRTSWSIPLQHQSVAHFFCHIFIIIFPTVHILLKVLFFLCR
mmetsp:Transcript_4214/g.10269  ORF Transcript_4214/g.10269 Transcript_4214/m.10269 type:complete len:113 (-) Transcript_4214:358-696(-)